jgi:hypothetical protein
MEISWTDRVRNKKVLHRVEGDKNVLHTVKRRKANWTGHILRWNGLVKHFIEGKIRGKDRSDGKVGKKTSAATG